MVRSALIALFLLATPAWAEGPPPHSGIVRARTMPELSDIALFGVAAAGLWLARRAMRARKRRAPRDWPAQD